MPHLRALSIVVAATLAVTAGVACGRKPEGSRETQAGSMGSMLAEVTGQVRVVASEHGFSPASVALPRGAPGSKATLTFVRTTDDTCATEVVFPDLNVKKDLPLNTPVTVDVPTDVARSYTFQCGMAMYKGAMVVK